MQPSFVVLTDFTTAAEAAIRYTIRLATKTEGRLVLLHVYQDPVLEPTVMAMNVPLVMSTRKQIQADLLQRAEQMPLPTEVELTANMLPDAVTDVVQRYHPLLLVLGREKSDTLLDRLIRHQAAPILQAAHYPLLLVPESWTETELPSRIAVAVDDHSFWLTAPSLALTDLLTALQPDTTVVHVTPDGPASGQNTIGLEAVHRTAMFGPLPATCFHHIPHDDPAEGILQAATDLQTQLLVVLARPHTFLGSLFHRSVTAQLLRHSPVPVLVLPTMA
ncbi:hypothetical protein GCM10027346_14230 [Hymenobacter seoulensis]